MNQKTAFSYSIIPQFNFLFIIFFVLILFSFLPQDLWALDNNTAENLFRKNCIGCHINGGNIIRRSKNLKIKNLERNGIDSPEKIAKIAREGIGIMDGYEDLLKENEDQILGIWIWEQAQKAWIQE